MDISNAEKIVKRLARSYSHNADTRVNLETIGRQVVLSIDDLDLPSKSLTERIARNMRNYIRGIDTDRLTHLRDTLMKKYGGFFVKGLLETEDHPRDLARAIIRYTIEEVGGFKPEDAPRWATYEFFEETGIDDLLWTFYDNNRLRAIRDVYLDVHLPWEFGRVPDWFWSGHQGWKNAIIALEWFAEVKGIQSKEDCKKVDSNDFIDMGLSGLLQILFNDSPYLAFSTLFPDLEPWQAKVTPLNYFAEKSHRVKALKWYTIHVGIGQISRMTPEEVYDTDIRIIAHKETLGQAGLRGLLNLYSNSPYLLFADIFPEQILPWTLRYARPAWRDEPRKTAAEAVKWLFETYLMVPHDEIPLYATYELFWNVGFSGILTNRRIGFNSSPFAAVDNAYPNEFPESVFDRHRRIKSIFDL